MKKKVLSITLALTVAMGIALTGCGKEAESSEDKNTVATTIEEKSSETESTEVAVENETESMEEETVEDYTYCNLLSDPYFDMDNAIKDENGTASVQSAIKSAADKDLLYNIVDGDKYVEITEAEVYDVNRAFTVNNGTQLYPNLAYYGIDPNPQCSGVPQHRFYCMDTSFMDYGSPEYDIDQSDITIIKAYTIPMDDENSLSMIAGGKGLTLCEVEYNGTHYWTLNISLEQALGE